MRLSSRKQTPAAVAATCTAASQKNGRSRGWHSRPWCFCPQWTPSVQRGGLAGKTSGSCSWCPLLCCRPAVLQLVWPHQPLQHQKLRTFSRVRHLLHPPGGMQRNVVTSALDVQMGGAFALGALLSKLRLEGSRLNRYVQKTQHAAHQRVAGCAPTQANALACLRGGRAKGEALTNRFLSVFAAGADVAAVALHVSCELLLA